MVKEYSKADLAFDEDNFSNSRLCLSRASEQMIFRLFIMWLRRSIFELDVDTIVRLYFLLPVAITLVLFAVIVPTQILLAKCKILFLFCKK